MLILFATLVEGVAICIDSLLTYSVWTLSVALLAVAPNGCGGWYTTVSFLRRMTLLLPPFMFQMVDSVQCPRAGTLQLLLVCFALRPTPCVQQ